MTVKLKTSDNIKQNKWTVMIIIMMATMMITVIVIVITIAIVM